MKGNGTQRNSPGRFTKVLDNRKQPIRGLWRRNNGFLARLSVEDEAGRKRARWVPLKAATPAEAQKELRALLVERTQNRLRHIGQSPTLAEYLEQSYLPRLASSGKKPDTLTTERGHLSRWKEALGHLRLDKIRPFHVTAHLHARKAAGRSSRTANLALVMLRNVLRAAKVDGFLAALPVEGVPWFRCEKKSRALCTREDIERVCAAAATTKTNREGQTVPVTKNAAQLADFLRLLALCGAREQEGLKLRWQDVDFERGLLTVGATGDTKNREARHVDFSPDLEAHLRGMHARRAPDSQWLFPSPQRGERDERARSFRESLRLARTAADMPRFGFHDCRHHFISFAVMSGIDFMTIARWVGHKDGGILIGKVYGHLSNEHARNQAARLNFGPSIVAAQEATA